jgi:NADPH2 dehydrogenase
MRMADPIPQFSHLVEQLKLLGLAYLYIVEPRVNNNFDCETTDRIDFLLEIWGKTSPVLVASGYTLENYVFAVDKSTRIITLR